MQQLEKGPDLERRIEAFFRLNGYETGRNVVKEGRSGARHEIDVFAMKSDGVTDFSVAIECKAWATAIEKDVVSKLSFVLADLGLHKGIIVSLTGWTTGAELSAKQLGVELWGYEEIQNRLGQVAIAELELGPTNRTGRGLALAIEEASAVPRLLATARGFLGFGREEVAWIRLISIPCFVLALSHAKTRTTFLKGAVLETTTRWNLYEALSGTFLISFESPPELVEVILGTSLPARSQPRKIQREINDAIKKARTVVTQRAQTRYADRLAVLGIPADSEGTSVDHTEEIHVPFYVALLRTDDRQRFAAVDAVWGDRWSTVDQALTANASYINEALAPAESDRELVVPRTAGMPNLGWLIALVVVAGLEYFFVGKQLSAFLAAYSVTVGIVLLGAFVRWNREQR